MRQNRHSLVAPIRMQHGGDDKQAAEDGVTVVAGQFDETRLLHQAAQFDQVAGAGAPRVLTFLVIGPPLHGFSPAHQGWKPGQP
ncbi:hypothetical protein D3C71_2046210 [compost metagenome]